MALITSRPFAPQLIDVEEGQKIPDDKSPAFQSFAGALHKATGGTKERHAGRLDRVDHLFGGDVVRVQSHRPACEGCGRRPVLRHPA